MAESTALEALTAELLGDVGVLHDQVKALREVLPGVAEQVGGKLEVQTGTMLAAADKLRGVLSDMAKQVDAYAETATEKAVEASKVDIRQAAAFAAAESVRGTVGAEVRAVVALVNEAAAQLAREAERTQASISAASRQVAWGWGKGLSAMFGASLLGALSLFVVLQVSGLVNIKPAELSETDRQALNNGRTLNKVWNNLTQKERDHINELAKAAQ